MATYDAQAADMWMLGVTLFEAAFGFKPPFHRGGSHIHIMDHRDGNTFDAAIERRVEAYQRETFETDYNNYMREVETLDFFESLDAVVADKDGVPVRGGTIRLLARLDKRTGSKLSSMENQMPKEELEEFIRLLDSLLVFDAKRRISLEQVAEMQFLKPYLLFDETEETLAQRAVSATTVQRAFRGRKEKDRFLTLKQKVLKQLQKKEQVDAATTIQSVFRGRRVRDRLPRGALALENPPQDEFSTTYGAAAALENKSSLGGNSSWIGKSYFPH